jgi:alkylation response protein AidB-like acyl-CoA dehydrogenase
MVKLFNLKIVLNKAIECFQFYRNYGYIKKNKVKKSKRELKITKTYIGTSEIEKLLMSRNRNKCL